MSTNSLAPFFLSVTSEVTKKIPERPFEVVLIVREHVERCRVEPISDDSQ